MIINRLNFNNIQMYPFSILNNFCIFFDIYIKDVLPHNLEMLQL